MFTINGQTIQLDGKPYANVRKHEPSTDTLTYAQNVCKEAGAVVRLTGMIFAMRDDDGEFHFWETCQ